MFTSPRIGVSGLRIAALLLFVLLGTLLLAGGRASAATQTFPAKSVERSTVVFEPRGISPHAVEAAELLVDHRSYPVRATKVRRGIRTEVLRLHVPRSRTTSRHLAISLRVRVSENSGIGATSPASAPTPAPAPAPTSPSKNPGKPTHETTPPVQESPAPESPPVQVSPAEPVGQPQPAPAASTVTIPSDARYVSASGGSDSNSGSATAPWQTLAKAVSSVGPGDVVVLEPGTYGGLGVTTNVTRSGSAGDPIVFTSEPGASRAIIRGYVRVIASHVRLDSLVFDGPTGGIVAKSSSNPGGEEVQVSIMYGTDVTMSNSEVRDNDWHAGVFVSEASDVRLLSNYVHDNGDAAAGANLDHGIYWCSGSGTIEGNVVEDNVAYGIQLYPTAAGVTVSHNTIVGNRSGGIVVGNEAAGNQILDNVVADNSHYGIRGYNLTGSGNVARGNLVWKNGEDTAGTGISFSGTIVADPATAAGAVGAQAQ
jgi:parallel beta-helix repeat protein